MPVGSIVTYGTIVLIAPCYLVILTKKKQQMKEREILQKLVTGQNDGLYSLIPTKPRVCYLQGETYSTYTLRSACKGNKSRMNNPTNT